MTEDQLNQAAAQRQAANMRAMIAMHAGDVVDLRTQLEVAHMKINSLEEDAKLEAAKLEAAEKQVEESGGEIERLTRENADLLAQHEKLLTEYSAYVDQTKARERERVNASRRKPRK